jgi:hypothetical protein
MPVARQRPAHLISTAGWFDFKEGNIMALS